MDASKIVVTATIASGVTFCLCRFWFRYLQHDSGTKYVGPKLSRFAGRTLDTIAEETHDVACDADTTERLASESVVEMVEFVVSSQALSDGHAMGGTVLSWIDLAAGIAAVKHARKPVVTVSVDSVHFVAPVVVGCIAIVKARINRSWRTSLEVEVTVEQEELTTGIKKFCCHAFLTFVGLKEGIPVIVPCLIADSDEAELRHKKAGERRAKRLEDRSAADRRLKQTKVESIIGLPSLASPGSHRCPDHAFTSNGVQRSSDRSINAHPTDANLVKKVMPNHANSLGITFGGQIMAWMEQCAAITAFRHARSPAVATLSIDSCQFRHPTYSGDVVTIRSRLVRAFTTSFEVFTTVTCDSAKRGQTYFTNDCFLTFVALDELHRPTAVPSFIPLDPVITELYHTAPERRQKRLEERKGVILNYDHTSVQQSVQL